MLIPLTRLLPSLFLFTTLLFQPAMAQFQRGPQITSPEVKEGKVTFRLLAPNVTKVQLSGTDIRELAKDWI